VVVAGREWWWRPAVEGAGHEVGRKKTTATRGRKTTRLASDAV
jgi:hypothetical protein